MILSSPMDGATHGCMVIIRNTLITRFSTTRALTTMVSVRGTTTRITGITITTITTTITIRVVVETAEALVIQEGQEVRTISLQTIQALPNLRILLLQADQTAAAANGMTAATATAAVPAAVDRAVQAPAEVVQVVADPRAATATEVLPAAVAAAEEGKHASNL